MKDSLLMGFVYALISDVMVGLCSSIKHRLLLCLSRGFQICWETVYLWCILNVNDSLVIMHSYFKCRMHVMILSQIMTSNFSENTNLNVISG